MRNFVILLLLGLMACGQEMEQVTFDQEKWLIKEGKDYPHREQMVNDVLYNDTIRSLNKAQLLGLLGAPDRNNEGHLYYLIKQPRLLGWPLHTTTLVVKMEDENKVEWIKLHK